MANSDSKEGSVYSEDAWPAELPPVILIGCGVVGQAIADAHLSNGIAFCLADADPVVLGQAVEAYKADDISVRSTDCPVEGLHWCIIGEGQGGHESRCPIVIESVIEKLEVKQRLFESLQRHFGHDLCLCTNTSTLLVSEIAGDAMPAPERLCGLHFFMPVHQRAAVEIIAGDRTDADVVSTAADHAMRLGKRAIHCQDGPGFIVNRMLSPYLNQALLLLCQGATSDQIERVARAYGMPLSPLELIDWIGAPTMYHAGRAFCSAFPKRVDPSPVVPALVKRKLNGRATGRGLFDYDGGRRSRDLSDDAKALVEAYRTQSIEFTDGDVLMLLAIPMWIEACTLLDEGVAESMETVDLAMAGGLGYNSDQSWSAFFRELGSTTIDQAIERWSGSFRSMGRG